MIRFHDIFQAFSRVASRRRCLLRCGAFARTMMRSAAAAAARCTAQRKREYHASGAAALMSAERYGCMPRYCLIFFSPLPLRHSFDIAA
jgi:hypothetical protein